MYQWNQIYTHRVDGARLHIYSGHRSILLHRVYLNSYELVETGVCAYVFHLFRRHPHAPGLIQINAAKQRVPSVSLPSLV
jgi:hypothetical protein